MRAPVILWFRQDLRLADNPALRAAMAEGAVLPLYILDDAAAGDWAPGGASRWWLHHSLEALAQALEKAGAPLTLLQGRAETIIPALVQSHGVASVHAGRLIAPWARERDRRIAEALETLGATLHLHTSSLLVEPHRLRTQAGEPYAVYSPFAKAIFALGEPEAELPPADKMTAADPPEDGLALSALALLPDRDWAAEFPRHWTPGEAGAAAHLQRFLEEAHEGYAEGRNIPGEDGTSRLSPHLHWGEISPRQVWHATRAAGAEGKDTFLKEVLWREFSYHLLWHRPELPEHPLRKEYERFPWAPDAAQLRAWQRGRTGFPLVDAGMRQLWRMGWMHNRVRMVCASFLVKHLLQPWQDGAAWFWDTLVDADLANNSASWQWVAGSGSDAAPYFRVFNPILQSKRFDPEGRYIRRWLPELAALPDAFLHEPWTAPASVRETVDYPAPIIPHEEGRQRALDAFEQLKA